MFVATSFLTGNPNLNFMKIILNSPHILYEIKYDTKKKLLKMFVAALFMPENNISLQL